MPIESNGHEHELEPEYGLPEALPRSERLLWQGTPDFTALARSAFHLQTLAIYFGVLLVLRAGSLVSDGLSLSDTLFGLALTCGIALLALAAIAALAWMTTRTTVYTITDKRVVMRIGIVLTLTFNLPLRMIDSAGLRKRNDASGDIVLKLRGNDHIAWLNLWPHVRPWRLARPEPMLRAVPNADHVATLLSNAWSQANGVAVVQPAPVTSPQAQQPAHWQPHPT